ncbi:MAG: deoxyribose-phosphate aldolase [Candidatus Gastranaerophilales bacterium]|nr:deoxyribose-phosphate aldolase [Candidatus Gastranaerophilales bacterium]
MDLAKYIEHTKLSPSATPEDIKLLVEEAIYYGFLGVCVNPQYVKFAADLIKEKNARTKVISTVNFPLGANKINTTLSQIEDAIKDGADEIDTVINIGALKAGNCKQASDELILQREASKGKILKVILETDLLTGAEIKIACLNCVSANVDFVKTSTGFVKDGIGATVENVKLMYQTVGKKGIGVKAAGGIKSKLLAYDLINAGATRLGTSSGVQLMK